MLWEYLQENHGDDMAVWLKYYARLGIMNAYKTGRTRPVSSGAPGLLMKPQPINTQPQSQEEDENNARPVTVKARELPSTAENGIVDVDEITVVQMPGTVEKIPSFPASSAIQAENAISVESKDKKEERDALDILNHLDDIVVDNAAKNHEQKLSRFIPVEDDEDVLGLIERERGK